MWFSLKMWYNQESGKLCLKPEIWKCCIRARQLVSVRTEHGHTLSTAVILPLIGKCFLHQTSKPPASLTPCSNVSVYLTVCLLVCLSDIMHALISMHGERIWQLHFSLSGLWKAFSPSHWQQSSISKLAETLTFSVSLMCSEWSVLTFIW